MMYMYYGASFLVARLRHFAQVPWWWVSSWLVHAKESSQYRLVMFCAQKAFPPPPFFFVLLPFVFLFLQIVHELHYKLRP